MHLLYVLEPASCLCIRFKSQHITVFLIFVSLIWEGTLPEGELILGYE